MARRRTGKCKAKVEKRPEYQGRRDLVSFDWIVVSSSAGKDSQAMLDLIVERARAAGVLDRVVVVHADMGRAQWKGTVELAAEQAAHYGLRFEVVRRTQDDLLEHAEKRGKWFGPGAGRWCTSDHKRGPIMTLFTRLVRESRDAGVRRPVRLLNCIGLRAEESPDREARPEWEPNPRACNGKREVVNHHPVIEWTLEQVWTRIHASGVRYHIAYDLGMSRLSCCFCPFASRCDLVIAARANPELLAQYVATEQRIQHRFTLAHSIAEIAAEAAQPDQRAA